MRILEGQSMLFYFLVTYNANICQTLMKTKAQAEKNALHDICSQTSCFIVDTCLWTELIPKEENKDSGFGIMREEEGFLLL